jgi:hypothetical protein
MVGTASDTGTTVLVVQYFPLPAWVFSLLTEPITACCPRLVWRSSQWWHNSARGSSAAAVAATLTTGTEDEEVKATLAGRFKLEEALPVPVPVPS